MVDVNATMWGMPLKYISLVTLTVQNSALILVMHYSRIMPTSTSTPNAPRYFTSTAVFLNEVIKLAICAAVALRDGKRRDDASFSLGVFGKEVFGGDAWKLMIPAALYTLQNNLQYVAVSNLDAASFQVTYQLKILTTALFSVTMLHRSLSLLKWISLILLTAGVAIVQLPTSSSPAASHTTTDMNPTLGLVAVLVACLISGLAGVYFEKVLKGTSATLWVRNVQLSCFSLIPAIIGMVSKDGVQIRDLGFFWGYNPVVWGAIMLQAAGGIVVALCVAYADNIMKNFATSVSILISFIASVYLFSFVITMNFVIGCSVVLFATYLYTKPDAPKKEGYLPAPAHAPNEDGKKDERQA